MPQNIVERILAKVAKADDGCWVFLGAIDGAGYGKVVCRRFNGRIVTEWVHRVIYMAFNGDIVTGLVVRHTCDNPPCCNPAHLILGTQKENVHDQLRQGRHTSQRRRVIEAPF